MKQTDDGRRRTPRDSTTIALFATLLATTACVSAPTGETGDVPLTDVSTVNVGGFLSQQLTTDLEFVSKEVPVESTLIWGVLPGVYQQLGIPVTNSDPQKMQVGNAGFEVQRVDGSRMNHFLDCGTSRGGPLANSYQVTLTVTTKLTKLGEDRTEVSSLVSGTAVNRSTAGYSVSCKSRETLEELIADRVVETLQVAGS